MTSIAIDPSGLPIFPVVQAMTMTYNEAMVRLANHMSLKNYSEMSVYSYRIFVKEPGTDDYLPLQYIGEEAGKVNQFDFPLALSMLTIVRITNYKAIYGDGIVTITIEEDGAMSRLEALFNSRPEFDHLKIAPSKLLQSVSN